MQKKKGFKFNCDNCGKEVECPPSCKPGKLKFCSRGCRWEYVRKHQIRKICPVCRTEYAGSPQSIYCSLKCKRKIRHAKESIHRLIKCPDCGEEREVFMPAYKRPTRCPKCATKYRTETRPNPKGAESHSWKGGRRVDTYGYVKLHRPGHPFADSTNYVREHLYIVTEAYGEEFVKSCGGSVHHINGNKSDNQLENLVVCTQKENIRFNAMLLEIAFALVQKGLIQFEDGRYYCPLLSDEEGEAT